MDKALVSRSDPKVAMGYEVNLFGPNEIEHYWPLIQKELKLVRHTWEHWWTEDSLYQSAISGHFQTWGVGTTTDIRLVLFTQIIQYPANRVLQCVLMLGNSLDEALPVIAASLQKYASDTECAFCEIVGRPGWARKLQEYGFAKQSVVLTCKVNKVVRH